MNKRREYRDDLYQVYARYKNEWVALTPDESKLLGHSPDLTLLAKKAKGQGYDHPRFIHIPPADLNFAL